MKGSLFKPWWEKLADADTRKLAKVRKTGRQQTLIKIAKSSPNYIAREIAIGKIKNDTVLYEIAINDRMPGNCVMAVRMIKDQTILARLAKTALDWRVRTAAVERIRDKDVLAEIAMAEQHETVCKTAVQRVDDEAVLAEIAKKHWSPNVREAAVCRLKGFDSLMEVMEQFLSMPQGLADEYRNRMLCTAIANILKNEDIPLEKKRQAMKQLLKEMRKNDLLACDVIEKAVPMQLRKPLGIKVVLKQTDIPKSGGHPYKDKHIVYLDGKKLVTFTT